MHDPLALAVVINRKIYKFGKMHCVIQRFRRFDYPFLIMSDEEPLGNAAIDVEAKRLESWLSNRLASPWQ